MISSTTQAFVWVWLPEQTAPVVADTIYLTEPQAWVRHFVAGIRIDVLKHQSKSARASSWRLLEPTF